MMQDKPRYYRRDGTPYADWVEWSKDFEGRKNKFVKKTDLWWGGVVSTIWLGIDYNFFGEGEPLIFETMVFPKNSWRDLHCARYSTELQAYAGHARVVAYFSRYDIGAAVLIRLAYERVKGIVEGWW